MESPTTQTTQPKKQKAHSLKEILLSLGLITNVSYEPFQPEPKQVARALLPPSFPTNPHPFDYFSLFFIRELF
jgi:hypothetical protein